MSNKYLYIVLQGTIPVDEQSANLMLKALDGEYALARHDLAVAFERGDYASEDFTKEPA